MVYDIIDNIIVYHSFWRCLGVSALALAIPEVGNVLHWYNFPEDNCIQLPMSMTMLMLGVPGIEYAAGKLGVPGIEYAAGKFITELEQLSEMWGPVISAIIADLLVPHYCNDKRKSVKAAACSCPGMQYDIMQDIMWIIVWYNIMGFIATYYEIRNNWISSFVNMLVCCIKKTNDSFCTKS